MGMTLPEVVAEVELEVPVSLAVKAAKMTTTIWAVVVVEVGGAPEATTRISSTSILAGRVRGRGRSLGNLHLSSTTKT